MKNVLEMDRRSTVQELGDMLDFSYCIVQRIITCTEEIGMQCVSEHWVQKLLSTEEGEQYVSES